VLLPSFFVCGTFLALYICRRLPSLLQWVLCVSVIVAVLFFGRFCGPAFFVRLHCWWWAW
jgi:hypothetical protein